jgi:hypothetical protein
MTNHLLPRENLSSFAAGNIIPYAGRDPNGFSESNNAWCVVLDVDSAYPSNAPVLFTRNLEISNIASLTAAVLADKEPFGKQGAVVIYRDGNAKIVTEKNLVLEFNSTQATNRVLRP